MKRKTPMSPDAMREACDLVVQRMREAHEALARERQAFDKRMRESLRRRPRPPKRKGGGSEPVTVEPNRPKLGEGGAAAALEFDSDEDEGRREKRPGKVAGHEPVQEKPE